MNEPYRYDECGLDNVYLANGFELVETPRGKELRIHDVDGLHQAIGNWLVTEKKNLSGKEIRFLRHELLMSQRALASLLGVDEQTVARWEKSGATGKNKPNASAERTIRLLYLEKMEGNNKVEEFLQIIADLEDAIDSCMTFVDDEHGWNIAA